MENEKWNGKDDFPDVCTYFNCLKYLAYLCQLNVYNGNTLP